MNVILLICKRYFAKLEDIMNVQPSVDPLTTSSKFHKLKLITSSSFKIINLRLKISSGTYKNNVNCN